VIQVIAASENYLKVFESNGKQCPSTTPTPDGKYEFKFGDENFILYEKNTRGDEYSKFMHLLLLLEMHRGLILFQRQKGNRFIS